MPSGIWLRLAVAACLFVAGLATGIKYHAGLIAREALAAQVQLDADRQKQRQANDQAAAKNSQRLATLSKQLGDARETIAHLSGRTCLNAGTVRMLNDIGSEPVRAAASEPAPAPTAAGSTDEQPASSDIDVARAIAQCRAGYAGLAGQLDAILDIEEARHALINRPK